MENIREKHFLLDIGEDAQRQYIDAHSVFTAWEDARKVLKRSGAVCTFELRSDQRYTAVNSKGFEVDLIRREAKDDDPHPLRITGREDDFYVVQAKKAGILLDSPKFSSMVVATTGHMARMKTISPSVFIKFKRWMAEQTDRDFMKRRRDILQADLVEELIEEYLPTEVQR